MSDASVVNMVERGPAAVAGRVARYASLIVAAVLFLIPFYLLVRNALSPEAELSKRVWRWWPGTWEWSNFTKLFSNSEVPMLRSLINSGVVATIQTVGVVVISGMAGYGLARIPYRWSNLLMGVIAGTLLIPAAVTFVPSFVMMDKFHWVGTKQGLQRTAEEIGRGTLWSDRAGRLYPVPEERADWRTRVALVRPQAVARQSRAREVPAADRRPLPAGREAPAAGSSIAARSC